MKELLNGNVILYKGDCLESVKLLPDNSVDAICTDPPYHLTSIVERFGKQGSAVAQFGTDGAFSRASKGFMGKEWDGGDIAFRPETWAEFLRVLKPGGHMVAFAAAKNAHRMICAIEDGGFEIRDTLMWVYGTGFPKSQNISKTIDKKLGKRGSEGEIAGKSGSQRNCMAGDFDGGEYHDVPESPEAKQWEGWGSALKPAYEPICLARKPFKGTIADNVMKHGTGAINIDGCRVGSEIIDNSNVDPERFRKFKEQDGSERKTFEPNGKVSVGRYPANFIHDGSNEILAVFPTSKDGVAVNRNRKQGSQKPNQIYGKDIVDLKDVGYGEEGSAARFFYSAKASKKDRKNSKHPTVKPISLMRYLCRLITPPGGTILDPFAGSGSTGEAAYLEGFKSIMFEREDEYFEDIINRFDEYKNGIDFV